MSAEERIADLERRLDIAREHHTIDVPVEAALLAIACEIRALRLMLRDEIREAAWRLAPAGSVVTPGVHYEPLASRKAPLEDTP